MKENEIKAQIKLINHLLNAFCECELTANGRLFLEKLRDKLNKKLNVTGTTKK